MTLKNPDYICRLAFEVTPEQKDRASKLFKVYGLRRAIFSRILDDLLDIIEFNGPQALGVLISGKVKPHEIIPVMARAAEEGKDMLQEYINSKIKEPGEYNG